jgi:hypothetical protein
MFKTPSKCSFVHCVDWPQFVLPSPELWQSYELPCFVGQQVTPSCGRVSLLFFLLSCLSVEVHDNIIDIVPCMVYRFDVQRLECLGSEWQEHHSRQRW